MRELYTKEWFPKSYAVGISWDDFWEMNPRIINAHIDGYKLRMKEENAMHHLQGAYTKMALEATVGNIFRKKGTKPIEYPSEPFELFGKTEQADDKPKTDEDSFKKVQLLFARLNTLKMNWDLQHMGKDTRGEE